jgi:hypothetical protein
LLPSDPGEFHQELVAQDLPGAKVEKISILQNKISPLPVFFENRVISAFPHSLKINPKGYICVSKKKYKHL